MVAKTIEFVHVLGLKSRKIFHAGNFDGAVVMRLRVGATRCRGFVWVSLSSRDFVQILFETATERKNNRYAAQLEDSVSRQGSSV